MKLLFQILSLITLSSCSEILGGKHLKEKRYKGGNITAKWYQISDITSIHDFIDIERYGWTKTIVKANTAGIYDLLIKGDTITIQTTKGLLIYDLTAKTLGCYIKLDSSITLCQYMKKHVPENAQYYCDEANTNISIKSEGGG